jgi:hypothetical protein
VAYLKSCDWDVWFSGGRSAVQRSLPGSVLRLERETGIEPATNGLGSRYSTIELLPPAITRLF